VSTDRILLNDVDSTESVKPASHAASTQKSAATAGAESWNTRITADLAQFIAAQVTVSLATATASGQPYIHFRSGPAGFLQVVDDRRIAIPVSVDDSLFITFGNLAENPKAHLFLADPPMRSRVRIWGEAGILENVPDPSTTVERQDTGAPAEKVLVFTLSAWDANWPQYISMPLEAPSSNAPTTQRRRRLRAIREEIAKLNETAPPSSNPDG
jgi:uncharacterized protein